MDMTELEMSAKARTSAFTGVVCDLGAGARHAEWLGYKNNWVYHDRDLRLLSISITASSVAYGALAYNLSSSFPINISQPLPSSSGPFCVTAFLKSGSHWHSQNGCSTPSLMAAYICLSSVFTLTCFALDRRNTEVYLNTPSPITT